jgi:acetolactate synthase-1/2/3 large subunit
MLTWHCTPTAASTIGSPTRGTDFAPVVETLAKSQILETKVPTPITCPHENTAMHIAIGYFLVTGRPQAVMVHVNVGTANGMNGLLNAARSHVPVVIWQNLARKNNLRFKNKILVTPC